MPAVPQRFCTAATAPVVLVRPLNSVVRRQMRMVSAIYISIDGRPVSYDLDRVSDIAQSYSGKRAGWTCTLIHIRDTDAFVELRSSPQDIRGNSAQEEQEEVDAEYIGKTYGLGPDDLASVRSAPSVWTFVDRRQ
jgi:hypothetical protein